MSAVDAPLITKTEVGMLPKIHKVSDLYIITSRAILIGAFILIILISAWDKLSCNISSLLIFNILCAMMNISDMHVGLYFNRTLSTYNLTAKKRLILLQLIASLTISIAIQIYGQITIFSHSPYTNCRKGWPALWALSLARAILFYLEILIKLSYALYIYIKRRQPA